MKNIFKLLTVIILLKPLALFANEFAAIPRSEGNMQKYGIESSIVDPMPLAHNPRIRTFVYKEDFIYRFVGNYEYQSMIQFQPGEVVQTISMGDTSGWEIVNSGNRLFMRPKTSSANTLMTLITNKRLYQFILEARSAESVTDPEVVLEVRFIYSDSNSAGSLEIYSDGNSSLVPDTTRPGNFNFQYTYSGAQNIAPIRVFDDAEFTYFEFSERNAELPAIFYVDSDGYEGLVNYKVSGNYIIVERVTDLFTLRNGEDTICVFNEQIYSRISKD